jgi:uncharacterized protein
MVLIISIGGLKVLKFLVASFLLLFIFKNELLYAQGNSNPSFDCSKASIFAEKLVCSNSELGRLDRQLAQLYKKHYDREPNKAKARQRQLTFLKNRNFMAQEVSRSDKKFQVEFIANVYQRRINYLQRVLNPPSNYMRGWLNLDTGQRDPCHGQYDRCDVRKYGFKGVWGNDRILWYPDLWIKLDEGDPDPCFGIYSYDFCSFTGNIMDGNYIVLKPPRF